MAERLLANCIVNTKEGREGNLLNRFAIFKLAQRSVGMRKSGMSIQIGREKCRVKL